MPTDEIIPLPPLYVLTSPCGYDRLVYLMKYNSDVIVYIKPELKVEDSNAEIRSCRKNCR